VGKAAWRATSLLTVISLRIPWDNAALYEIRQAFIHQGVYLPYPEMQQRMQSHEAYKALPAKVSQQVLMQLHRNWIAFFEECKAYKEDPSKFTGRPKMPKYKDKTKGRNLLIYTLQALKGGQSKQGIQGICEMALFDNTLYFCSRPCTSGLLTATSIDLSEKGVCPPLT
jgi:hypothetical protein